MRSGNPALNDKIFQASSSRELAGGQEVMTLEGTVNKCFISIVMTIAAAYWSFSNPEVTGPYMLPAILVALVLALVVAFKQAWAPYITPLYALVKGTALGTISLYFETMYPGIVFQAVSLTFGIFFALLMAYKSGAIKPSENFKLGIAAATGGIFLVYLLSMILGFFGVNVPLIHSSGLFGIGFSLFVCVIAALNLVLDFDFIENAAEQGNVPKYMEWYGAFGLLVTLIWLYIEILHLLAKLQSRD